MAAPKKNHFKKGSKKASDAGKKSKRSISLKRALREMFDNENTRKEIIVKGKKQLRINEDNFVKACAMAGMKGNAGMAKIIFEYIDGKVPDKVDADLNYNIKIIKHRGK